MLSADPAPDSVNGQVLTWNLGALPGNQWGGQIEVVTEIDATGTVVNTAELMGVETDVDPLNNTDDHSDGGRSGIIAPILVQPTQGMTDQNPTFKGCAPSDSVVESGICPAFAPPGWPAPPATTGGTFETELNLPLAPDEATYYRRHRHQGRRDQRECPIRPTVYGRDATLPLGHRTGWAITADGADVSRGVVRAQRRTLAHRAARDRGGASTALASPTATLRRDRERAVQLSAPAGQASPIWAATSG